MSARRAAVGLLVVAVFGCSAELDCSSVGCRAPEIVVQTDVAYPAGSQAELCGMGSHCVTVTVGVPTRDPSGVPLLAQPKVDRRWLREDLVRGSTDVRILDPHGAVLAQGVGSVVSLRQCCAGSTVRFPA